MLSTPISPWPSFTQEEADAAQRVLLSNKVNYWTGREAREFECEFAGWAGTLYAVCARMGQAGRERAERIFDVREVVATHLRIYEGLASES